MMGEEKGKINWSLVLFFLVVALLLTNFVSLWFTTRELPIGREIFYWQKFNSYSLGTWYLSCLLIPVALGIWAFIGIRKFRAAMIWFLLSIAALFICAFADYSALFILKFVNHYGTVELKGNVYQLAEVSNYDDETSYYLGECDPTGFKCVFHEIYRTYLTQRQAFSIELSGDLQSLLVKADGKVVYNFDGLQENCIDSYPGYCVRNLP